MRRPTRNLLPLIAWLSSAAFCQPVILEKGVVNAASYTLSPGAGNAIAPGSIFIIFGTGLGPTQLVQASALPLDTSLAGTSVTVTAGGQNRNAYLVYSSATQVAAILPSGTSTGPASVIVTYNSQKSAPAPLSIAPASPGIFTRNSAGFGTAVAQIFAPGADPSIAGFTNPAHPGQTIVLYGTGLGPISTPDNQAPGSIAVGSKATVTIGNKVITPAYAGRSPEFPGLDQINFLLPADVPLSCYVPAQVNVSGGSSNEFVLPIAAPNTPACSHPFNLDTSALTQLDNGGQIKMGVLLLARLGIFGLGSGEGAAGLFATVDSSALYQSVQALNTFSALAPPVALGQCAIFDRITDAASFTLPSLSFPGLRELDAGPRLTLAGPGGKTKDLPHQAPVGYFDLFFGLLQGGQWTFSAPGGADIAAFTAPVSIPDPVVWTNGDTLTAGAVSRNQPLTLTWKGGAADQPLSISVTSSVIDTADPSRSRGKAILCAARTGDGKFTIPADLLSQLPASPSTNAQVGTASIGLGGGGGATFTAPLTRGGKLDAGLIGYATSDSRLVNFQ